MVILAYYFDKRLARVYGIASAGTGIGNFILPPLFQILIDHFGWQGALLVISGLAANGAVFGALYRVSSLEIQSRSDKSTQECDTDKTVMHLETVSQLAVSASTQEVKTEERTMQKEATSLEEKSIRQIQTDSTDETNTDSTEKIERDSAGQIQTKCTKQFETKIETKMEEKILQEEKLDSAEQIKADSTEEIKPNFAHEIHTDSTEQIKAESTKEIKLDFANEIQTDSTEQMKAESTKETKPNFAHEIQTDSTEQIKAESTKEIKPDSTEQITVESTKEIKPDSADQIKTRKDSTMQKDTTFQEENPDSAQTPNVFQQFLAVVLTSFNFHLLLNVRFLLLFIANFPYGLGYVIILSYLPARAVHGGVSEIKAAFLTSTVGIVSLLARFTHGYIIDYKILTASMLTAIAFLLAAISCALFPISDRYPILVFLTVLVGLSAGVFNVTGPVVAKEYLGVNRVSGAVGLILMSTGAGVFVGLFLTGTCISCS